jgi:hypothetical protein
MHAQVCTYLRPSVLPHAELLDLEGVAKFVSEYILYEALPDGGRDPPELLASPASTLAWQVGPLAAPRSPSLWCRHASLHPCFLLLLLLPIL